MKRIGVISDPHGNLLALDAVLAELEREELDGLVCLGDVAVGPQPAETLARIRALGCPVVKGNWDDWFCEGIPPADDEIGRKLVEIGEFWAAQLSAEELEAMRGFAATVELDLGGATALCFHGSPSSNMEGILGYDEGRLRIDLRRTTYDVDALLQLSLESGMPHAQWWVDSWQRETTR